MKQITMSELLGMMDEEVHDRITDLAAMAGTTHLVLFQQEEIGVYVPQRTVLAIGEWCTYQSLEDVEGKWLHDLPSQRQYPVVYVELEKEE